MWTSEVSLSALRTVALIAAAVGCAVVCHRLARVEPLAPVVHGERGRQRALWLSRGGSCAAQDAAVRWLGAFLVGRLSVRLHASLRRALQLAGEPWGFGAEELVAASLWCALVGWSLCGLLSGVLGGGELVLVALVCPLVPALRVREARRARVKAIERSLPIAMDLVSLCVRAGSDFPAALRFVVSELSGAHPTCSHELSRVEEALALGRTRVDALEAFARRLDSGPVSRFVASMVQSERRGIPLADVLSTQAETLRRLRSVRAEESAAKAGVRMVVPLMLMVGAVLTLLLGPLVLDGGSW